MKRILVTGASGFLGSNFCARYAETYHLTALQHQHSFRFPGVTGMQGDLTDEDSLEKILDQARPHAILHLAALSQPNQCEKNPELSLAMNVEAPENLARLAAQRNIRFVFASTDLVFDGKKAPYAESDVPRPVSLYGMHKAIAEQAVLEEHPQAAVCRLPLMYGIGLGHGESFLQPLLRHLLQGDHVNLFSDEYRTVASARNVCEGLLLALLQGEGIYHLGGPERLSRYQMGKKICKAFGIDEALLVKLKQKDIPMDAPRPKDVSLTSERAINELGWQPRAMSEELSILVQATSLKPVTEKLVN